jgi:hypothetical protein
MKLMRTFTGALVSLGVCAAFLAACNDDDAPAVTPAADVAPPMAADAGAADAGPVAVPLTVWVNDLVTTFGPMSAPDTVDDKIIMDTEDPTAFDQLLQ